MRRHPAIPVNLRIRRGSCVNFDQQMAGDAIAAKAKRMLALAGSDLNKRARAGDLMRLASQVSGSDYYVQDLVIDDAEIDAKSRELAASEVYSLALRRVNEGTMKTLDAPKPGWVRGGDDFGVPINPDIIGSALALYDIALALHHNEEWLYNKAFLHERLHDFPAAARIFESLTGEFAIHGVEQAKRCHAKAAGADVDSAISNLDARTDELTGSANVIRAVRTQLNAALNKAPQHKSAAIRDSASSLVERTEQAVQVAQRFAEHLADGDYLAARALLARNLRRLHTDELRHTFEEMMGGTGQGPDGPADVCVMEASCDMPDLSPYDLAWVYVAVTNPEVNEAVTVIVTQEQIGPRIRHIEWGRP